MPPPAVSNAAKAEADRLLADNTSPRFRLLDSLARYADCTQYEGRPDFFDDSRPLFERAPCIRSKVVGNAVRSHVAMVLGEGQFPCIVTGADEDDSEFDEDAGLDEAASTILDHGVRVIARQTRLAVVARRLLHAAMVSRTAVAIACVRDGRLAIETTWAKWCRPTFDKAAPATVTKLEIRYPYLEEFTDPLTRRPSVRALLYRRVIDDKADTTYQPAKASAGGAEPDAWTPDPLKTYEHGLGFCPVVWYPFMKQEGSVAEIDGQAIHQHHLPEIVGLDFALSQRHRATLMTTDPLMVEIGVEPGFNPTATGVRASIWMPGDPEENKQWRAPAPAGAAGQVRRRAPGQAYQYPDNAKVSYLTLPGGALEASTGNAQALEQQLAEAFCWVPTDPKEMMSGAGTLSGKALEWLHKKQINYDVEVRADVGHGLILPLVSMLLRIVHRLGAGGGLYLLGVDKLLPILAKFEREQRVAGGGTGTRKVWMGPDMRLEWPAFFADTAADQKAVGDNVRADLTGGLITRATAVKKIAPFYGIDNPAQYAEDLDKADAAKRAEEHEAAEMLAPGGAQGAAKPRPKAAAAKAEEEAPPSSRRPTAPAPSRPAAGPSARPPASTVSSTGSAVSA